MPSLAHATCDAWDAGFSAGSLSDHESAALTFGWTEVVDDCGTFTFHHYETCWDKGDYGSSPSAPASPAAADDCVEVAGASSTAISDFVHRAYKDFSAVIFACDNEACDDWLGDDGETVTNDEAIGQTVQEMWMLDQIDGYTDTDRAIDDQYASCSAALIYPTGFDSAGMLGLWWSSNDHTNPQKIYQRRANTTTWEQWNTDGSWVADELVAEGTGSSGRYADPTHPWVAAVDDGSQYIRLFVQVETEPYEIEWIDSVDEDGRDFELECTLEEDCEADEVTCLHEDECDWENDSEDGGDPEEAICADGTSTCDYLSNAAHGRLLWDYIANGWAIDFSSDEMGMLFTGAPDGTTCSQLPPPPELGAPDDLYSALWASSSWSVLMDSGCPDAESEDRHDPAMILLPGAEFKRYAFEGTKTLDVAYWNCSSWEDESEVIVVFDDGSETEVDETCFDNPDTLVYKNGATTIEAMFVHVLDDPGCFSATTAGVVYATHEN